MTASGEVFGFMASENADYLVRGVIERQTPRLAYKKAQREEYSGDRRTARRSYTQIRILLFRDLMRKSFF
jgi:hypothetical protein